jgi:ATP-dependent helicase YprA (DUF1998 family)
VEIFDLDKALIRRYESFARSFSEIRAPEIRAQIDAAYADQRFWPEPLITINPHFEAGASIDQLVAQNVLDPALSKIFAGSERKPIKLHRHQERAVAKARNDESFIVTTGTGSGKSLCFFLPIVDAVVRARRAGEAGRTRAVIIYPMNALANSQLEELDKFIGGSGLEDSLRPTYRRYTGQESDAERQAIAAAKPDILLTNFMMLELLMTRQDDLDRAVIANAVGLDFLVLDELHTYRGRQGADVAMLVRRVKDRLVTSRKLMCIGTSATMSSAHDELERATAVARVGKLIFGSHRPTLLRVRYSNTSMLRPAKRMRMILASKNATLTYLTGWPTKSRTPKSVASAKPTHVHGSISRESSVMDRCREARPTSRRSTRAIEPRTSAMAATCAISRAGKSQRETRISSAIGLASIHVNKSHMDVIPSC